MAIGSGPDFVIVNIFEGKIDCAVAIEVHINMEVGFK